MFAVYTVPHYNIILQLGTHKPNDGNIPSMGLTTWEIEFLSWMDGTSTFSQWLFLVPLKGDYMPPTTF